MCELLEFEKWNIKKLMENVVKGFVAGIGSNFFNFFSSSVRCWELSRADSLKMCPQNLP